MHFFFTFGGDAGGSVSKLDKIIKMDKFMSKMWTKINPIKQKGLNIDPINPKSFSVTSEPSQ